MLLISALCWRLRRVEICATTRSYREILSPCTVMMATVKTRWTMITAQILTHMRNKTKWWVVPKRKQANH